MHIKRVMVRNFKGIQSLEFSMEDLSGNPRGLTALLGDNGSGKTTVLQAIALTLSMATRRTRDMASFAWHGFLPERIATLGPTCVELDVLFEREEVDLTAELFEAWYESLSSDRRQLMNIVPPSKHGEVTLRFEKGKLASPQGFEAINQFLGRYYIKALKDLRPEFKSSFSKLGDVFWFDQYRNLGALILEDLWGEISGRCGWQAGVEQLREYLVGWWGHHTTVPRRGKDFILPLEDLFGKIFPGIRFAGIMPRDEMAVPRAGDFYFLLDRDGRVYDLAEMSSGEQAVFPLIYEFVRLDIQRSVVLVDELELHLHPPEQQRLLGALPKVGPDCQFLITTHSEFISSAIPEEQKVRLKRGTICL
jgi:predicted ATPase